MVDEQMQNSGIKKRNSSVFREYESKEIGVK